MVKDQLQASAASEALPGGTKSSTTSAEREPVDKASGADKGPGVDKAPGEAAARPSSQAQPAAAPDKDSRRAPPPPADRRLAGTARRHIAANDDMPSIGGLIYALQQRPSRGTFIYALLASIVWFVLAGGVSLTLFRSDMIASQGAAFTHPLILTVAATILVPIALFWFLAVLVWRAQELRLMASAMTEVAVRLAEPDKMAEQSVASIGQTIRRQVAAMNDALSRALGRAGELEALVHNEVAALERSYSENEIRIRGLIDELSSEREALANNSERVSEALRGVGAQVAKDIASAGDMATKSLVSATSSIAETLAAKGEKITAAVSAAGQSIDRRLAERGAQVTEQLLSQGAHVTDKLQRAGQQVSAGLQQSTQQITAAMHETTRQVTATVESRRKALFDLLDSVADRIHGEMPQLLQKMEAEQTRLNSIIDVASHSFEALETSLAQRTDALDGTLKQRMQAMQALLADQSALLDETFVSHTQMMSNALVERIRALDSTLSERTRIIDQTLSENSGSVERSLVRHTMALSQLLAEGTEAVKATTEHLGAQSAQAAEGLNAQATMLKEVSGRLLDQIHGLTQRFENQGHAIMSAAQALDSSNAKIDSILERRHQEISSLLQAVSTKARDLDSMMHSYSGLIENALSKAEVRAKELTAALAKDSAVQSRAALAEIEQLRAETRAHTNQAVTELKSSFEAITGQVSDHIRVLTQHFTHATQEMRESAQQTAGEMESTRQEIQRRMRDLPNETRQSTEAMRKVLADQMKALSSLSAIAAEHGGHRDLLRPKEAPPPPPKQLRAPVAPPPPPTPPQRPPYAAGREEMDTVAADLARQLGTERVRLSPTSHGGGHAATPATPSEGRREPWSLGDLLARASEPERDPFMPPQMPTQHQMPSHQMPSHQMPSHPMPAHQMPSHQMPAQMAPHVPEPPQPSRTSELRFADIASAIDERTAAEVWLRYRRGERNVLSRHLYTIGGQQAFDEISHRYRRDPDFRATVDRYMGDFERLLRDTQAKDRDGRLVQNYLSSQTGRVYLMLAHASGRLN